MTKMGKASWVCLVGVTHSNLYPGDDPLPLVTKGNNQNLLVWSVEDARPSKGKAIL